MIENKTNKPQRDGFWEKLSKLNRRYIYMSVGICVIVPLLIRMRLPIFITPPTKSLYNVVDKIPPEDPENMLIISFDYDPSVMPELQPMGVALLKHCFAKKIRVACMSLTVMGIGLAEMATEKAKEEFPDVKYGEDYLIFAWVPGWSIVILKMGENIKETFMADYAGKSLDEFPIVDKIHNYEQVPALVCLTGSSTYLSWITYANTRYNETICTGITGVIAPEIYPWLQSGQISGMLGGIKGAAEYEILLKKNKLSKVEGTASVAMDPQSITHLLIMLFIVLANISYFVIRRKK
ncbi:hypothetical protein KAW65_01875 [candidate division WOR-3 bacterium]|nr:hypothetical protein [candidate division WOR-3 bacterium]